MIIKTQLYETPKMRVSNISTTVFKNADGMMIEGCLAQLNYNMCMLFCIGLN